MSQFYNQAINTQTNDINQCNKDEQNIFYHQNENFNNQQRQIVQNNGKRQFGQEITKIFQITNRMQQNNLQSQQNKCTNNEQISNQQTQCSQQFQFQENKQIQEEQVQKDVSPQIPSQLIDNQYDSTRKEQPQTILQQNINFSHSKLNNSLMIDEYADEIFKYLLSLEQQNFELNNYMAQQQDISESMRAILLDWLIDVQSKFGLKQQTIYQTQNIIDRYLQKTQIQRQKLQLIGVSSILIAWKYEETFSPDIEDLVYITDNSCTKQEIIEMEASILQTLQFNLNHTTAWRFLQTFSQLDKMDQKNYNLCQYVLELSIIDYKMCRYSPSKLAAATLYLVNKLRSRQAWSEKLIKISGYYPEEIRECAKEFCNLLQSIDNKKHLKAIKKKFSSNKYDQVGLFKLEQK